MQTDLHGTGKKWPYRGYMHGNRTASRRYLGFGSQLIARGREIGMKIYLYRFLGYLFLSLFLALTFGPYGGNPFSKPYHYNRLDSHASDKEKVLGQGLQKTTAQETALMQQTRKIMADQVELMRNFENERTQDEKSLKPIIGDPLKSRGRDVKYILAAFFLLSGLFLMRRVYAIQPGIPVNPRWAAITGDTIFILFLSIAAYCVIAYGLNKYRGITPYLYDPVAMGMVTAAYIPLIIFCAYFSSNLSTQSIEIGDEGIKVYYPANFLYSSWEDIQGFDLKETYTVAGGDEFRAPRKSQTKLVIHAKRGDMELFEPGLKKTKSALISALADNAPQRLQGEIGKLIKW